MVESNRKVMKALARKIKKATKKVGWQEQISDNERIIDTLSDHLRDSSRLPKSYRSGVAEDIDDLRDLNKRLRREKPNGYTLGVERMVGYYNRRAREQSILTGDESTGATFGSGGLSEIAVNSIKVWRDANDYRDATISDGEPLVVRFQGVMNDLDKEIQALLGTKTPDLGKFKDPAGAQTDAIKNDLLQEQLHGARINTAQFGALRDFAQLLGMRSVGAYAHGSLGIEQTGWALVHRGETIVPDPDGPFRTGQTMNALAGAGGRMALDVTIGLDDSGLLRVVDARVAGKAADVTTRVVGQRSRVLSAARGTGR
jgi:hypothetical protein